jgi:hypothetical protein
MLKFLEQCYSIKFAVKLGKLPTETVGMINQANGESVMSRNMIFRWHKMFVEGREESLMKIREKSQMKAMLIVFFDKRESSTTNLYLKDIL